MGVAKLFVFALVCARPWPEAVDLSTRQGSLAVIARDPATMGATRRNVAGSRATYTMARNTIS